MIIFGLICDDIRREIEHTETIVGVLPPNLTLKTIPGTISRLAVYVCAQASIPEEPRDIALNLRLPGNVLPLGRIDRDMIARSQRFALARGLSFGRAMMRSVLSSIDVLHSGTIEVVATVEGDDIVCANAHIEPEGAPARKAIHGLIYSSTNSPPTYQA